MDVDASCPVLTLKTEVIEDASPERAEAGPERVAREDDALEEEGEDDDDDDDNDDKEDKDESEEEKEDDEEEEGDQEEGDGNFEDEESLFSEDSDDDRTWMPERTKPREKVGKVIRLRHSHHREKEESSAASSGRFICKICQITFYKKMSYEQHMRSSKVIHEDLRKREKCRELCCADCSIVFTDRSSYAKHMDSQHKNKVFYCEKCDAYLQSESAFKSHNSKLHLERRERAFYCRECDQIFKCKVLHSQHIVSHRLWSGEGPGFQCDICGKIFTALQKVPYQRHMSTHDCEPEQDCSCNLCGSSTAVNSTSSNGERSQRNATRWPRREGSLLERMKETFSSVADSSETKDDEGEDDVAGSESLLMNEPFQCAVCTSKFATAAELESHVSAGSHSAIEDSAPSATKKVRRSDSEAKVSTEGLDRNWAAEFGYGKSALSSQYTGDLFSKMRSKFQVKRDCDDDEGGESGGDSGTPEAFRSRGLTGRVKASPTKAPRTLSDASLATRKRLESLIRRARECQERKSKAAAVSPASKEDDAAEDDDDCDDDFDGFEDEDEGLLIPLSNGWVCEKKPSASDPNDYTTTFWSPEGEHYEHLEDIALLCQGSKLDLAVFQRAVKRQPNKVESSSTKT